MAKKMDYARAEAMERARLARDRKPVLLATAKQMALIAKLRDELKMGGYQDTTLTRSAASRRIEYLLGVVRRRRREGR